MTTIVATRKGMWADSCLTTECGTTKTPKIFRVSHYNQMVLVALAGESGPGFDFLQWFRSDEPAEPRRKKEDFSALVLRADGIYLYEGWYHADLIQDPFAAIGKGGPYAMGALLAGADPFGAVEIACRLDPYSRPPVVYIPFELPTVAAALQPVVHSAT